MTEALLAMLVVALIVVIAMLLVFQWRQNERWNDTLEGISVRSSLDHQATLDWATEREAHMMDEHRTMRDKLLAAALSDGDARAYQALLRTEAEVGATPAPFATPEELEAALERERHRSGYDDLPDHVSPAGAQF